MLVFLIISFLIFHFCSKENKFFSKIRKSKYPHLHLWTTTEKCLNRKKSCLIFGNKKWRRVNKLMKVFFLWLCCPISLLKKIVKSCKNLIIFNILQAFIVKTKTSAWTWWFPCLIRSSRLPALSIFHCQFLVSLEFQSLSSLMWFNLLSDTQDVSFPLSLPLLIPLLLFSFRSVTNTLMLSRSFCILW